MNCSPIRTFTLLLLFIASLTTLYEVSKKYPVGKNQKVVTLQSSVVSHSRQWQRRASRHGAMGRKETGSARPQTRRSSAADILLEEVAGNGPRVKGKGGHLSLMMTTVDSAAAQALLPVFLDALHKTVPPAYNRLVVLSTDAEALSSCRRIHTYCLPWFDRRLGDGRSNGTAHGGGYQEMGGVTGKSRAAEAPSLPHLPPQWARVVVLQQLLTKGYDVIVSDADVVWLKNPFSSLAAGDSNFQLTVDSDVADDGSQKPCTGVMLVKASEPSRALVKAWLGLARSESGGPSLLFARAWSQTQSSYAASLQVSYLDAKEYPNGCAYLNAAKQGEWKEGKQSLEGMRPWVMWHAACLQGLQQKGKAMQGLLDLRGQKGGKPRGKHPSAL